MKTHHSRKNLALLIIVAGLLVACADKKDAIATGMIASLDGTPIRYQSQGEGETAIVFVHCWTCDHSYWNAQYESFAKDYKVVRLDLAGHGGSAPRKTYTMQAYGNDVVAVANALKLQRMVLVGHSMGGPVVVEAEKRLGNRVIGVVGVDVFYTAFNFPADEEGIQAFVKPFAESFNESREALVRASVASGADSNLVKKLTQTIPVESRDMAIQSLTSILRWSATEGKTSLAALGKRLVNINGDPSGEGTAVHDSVVLVKGAAHFVQMEQPEAFNKALRETVAHFEK